MESVILETDKLQKCFNKLLWVFHIICHQCLNVFGVHTCMHICTHTRMYAQMHACSMHPCMHMPTHACTHTHANIHTHTHTHTYTNTHTQTQKLPRQKCVLGCNKYTKHNLHTYVHM